MAVKGLLVKELVVQGSERVNSKGTGGPGQ